VGDRVVYYSAPVGIRYFLQPCDDLVVRGLGFYLSALIGSSIVAFLELERARIFVLCGYQVPGTVPDTRGMHLLNQTRPYLVVVYQYWSNCESNVALS